MRILLVEDDTDLQRLLKKALGDAGYVVDAPWTARKAISSATPNPMTR